MKKTATKVPNSKIPQLNQATSSKLGPELSVGTVLSAWASRSMASATTVQAKLKIGESNDAFEREADHFAAKATQETVNQKVNFGGANPSLAETIQPKEKEEAPKIKRGMLLPKLQFSGAGGTDAPPNLDNAIGYLRGSGFGLPAPLRNNYAHLIGSDLSGVRLHTGVHAATMNQQIGAKAFTFGQDIFFGAGQYDPSSRSGQELIAHEIAHTVQQGSLGVVRRAEGDDRTAQQNKNIRSWTELKLNEIDPFHFYDVNPFKNPIEYQSLTVELQEDLIKLGTFKQEADGYYGADLDAAVVEFLQKMSFQFNELIPGFVFKPISNVLKQYKLWEKKQLTPEKPMFGSRFAKLEIFKDFKHNRASRLSWNQSDAKQEQLMRVLEDAQVYEETLMSFFIDGGDKAAYIRFQEASDSIPRSEYGSFQINTAIVLDRRMQQIEAGQSVPKAPTQLDEKIDDLAAFEEAFNIEKKIVYLAKAISDKLSNNFDSLSPFHRDREKYNNALEAVFERLAMFGGPKKEAHSEFFKQRDLRPVFAEIMEGNGSSVLRQELGITIFGKGENEFFHVDNLIFAFGQIEKLFAQRNRALGETDASIFNRLRSEKYFDDNIGNDLRRVAREILNENLQKANKEQKRHEAAKADLTLLNPVVEMFGQLKKKYAISDKLFGMAILQEISNFDRVNQKRGTRTLTRWLARNGVKINANTMRIQQPTVPVHRRAWLIEELTKRMSGMRYEANLGSDNKFLAASSIAESQAHEILSTQANHFNILAHKDLQIRENIDDYASRSSKGVADLFDKQMENVFQAIKDVEFEGDKVWKMGPVLDRWQKEKSVKKGTYVDFLILRKKDEETDGGIWGTILGIGLGLAALAGGPIAWAAFAGNVALGVYEASETYDDISNQRAAHDAAVDTKDALSDAKPGWGAFVLACALIVADPDIISAVGKVAKGVAKAGGAVAKAEGRMAKAAMKEIGELKGAVGKAWIKGGQKNIDQFVFLLNFFEHFAYSKSLSKLTALLKKEGYADAIQYIDSLGKFNLGKIARSLEKSGEDALEMLPKLTGILQSNPALTPDLAAAMLGSSKGRKALLEFSNDSAELAKAWKAWKSEKIRFNESFDDFLHQRHNPSKAADVPTSEIDETVAKAVDAPLLESRQPIPPANELSHQLPELQRIFNDSNISVDSAFLDAVLNSPRARAFVLDNEDKIPFLKSKWENWLQKYPTQAGGKPSKSFDDFIANIKKRDDIDKGLAATQTPAEFTARADYDTLVPYEQNLALLESRGLDRGMIESQVSTELNEKWDIILQDTLSQDISSSSLTAARARKRVTIKLEDTIAENADSLKEIEALIKKGIPPDFDSRIAIRRKFAVQKLSREKGKFKANPKFAEIDLDTPEALFWYEKILTRANEMDFSDEMVEKLFLYKCQNPKGGMSLNDLVSKFKEGYEYNPATKRLFDPRSKIAPTFPNANTRKTAIDGNFPRSQESLAEIESRVVGRESDRIARDSLPLHEKGFLGQMKKSVINESEYLGELAAQDYGQFLGGKRLYPPDEIVEYTADGSKIASKSTSGASEFDQIWEVDGEIIVIEAKGGSKKYSVRQLKYGPNAGEYAEQGTREYLDDIIEVMSQNPNTKELADRMKASLRSKKLKYQEVHQKLSNPGEPLPKPKVTEYDLYAKPLLPPSRPLEPQIPASIEASAPMFSAEERNFSSANLAQETPSTVATTVQREVGVVSDPLAIVAGNAAGMQIGVRFRNENAGLAILDRLQSGDLTALKPIGIPELPKTFDPTKVEWGLAKVRGKEEYFIVGPNSGSKMEIDWDKIIEEVEPIAHTHPILDPSRGLRHLSAVSESRKLDDILTDEVNRTFLLPSAPDLNFFFHYGERGSRHTVFTPYYYDLNTGEVLNTIRGNRSFQIKINFDLPDAVGTMPLFDGGPVWKAPARFIAGGQVVKEADIYAFIMQTGMGERHFIGLNPPTGMKGIFEP